MENILKKGWSQLFKYDWKFGLFLILLFGIPRFILVLQANTEGGYGTVSIIFIIMWFTPLLFLTKSGRKYIGISKPQSLPCILYSFLAGILFCILLFGILHLLFTDTIANSFVYISRSYLIPEGLSGSDKLTFFFIFALTGMIFSPIGEELLYRGIIHGSFVNRFGETKASFLDSIAFATTHLSHFGIIYYAGKWDFLILPSAIWLVSMFLVSQLFFRCKQLSGSILGAIVCHAGYNLAMIYFIIYHIY
ncbi:MAG: CPBP family intramembrane glutamic endopeptidase [Dysgonomonas sp.]|nr:CPBP family intramembrane glutamic endopeptidase [Dysgonomonas sp.]